MNNEKITLWIVALAVGGIAIYLASKGISDIETASSNVSTLWIIPIVLIAIVGGLFLFL